MIIVAGMCMTFIFKYMTKYQEEVKHSMKSRVEYVNVNIEEDEDIDDNQSANSDTSIFNKKVRKVSVNPDDYGCKRYTELDIEAHSIMIEGLP